MGVQITAQLLLFVQSILLGLAAGAVYAFLRPLRRLWPALAPVLDLLYALALAFACSAFLLRPADGVLRGYTVLGGLGGAALWFCGFDDASRPLWTFWAETAAWLVSLALLPVRLSARFLRFLRETGNSLFYFARKCCTIRFGYRRPRRVPARGQSTKSGPACQGKQVRDRREAKSRPARQGKRVRDRREVKSGPMRRSRKAESRKGRRWT